MNQKKTSSRQKQKVKNFEQFEKLWKKEKNFEQFEKLWKKANSLKVSDEFMIRKKVVKI